MKQYIVDAFTDTVFAGNPAAICITDEWLPDELMMKITLENNLSETAFAVPEGENFHLRWFTPGGEIDLCGHATLAAAYVIMRFYRPERAAIGFRTLSGLLTVTREGERLSMNFPAYALKQIPVTDAMIDAIGAMPTAAYIGRDLLCVMDSEETVRNVAPDLEKLLTLDGLLLHVTAEGTNFDCVSRTFAPKLNVCEDPVCGSGHCHIVPYWAKKKGKNELVAYQASRRGGVLYSRLEGDRIILSGAVALYSEATIHIDSRLCTEKSEEREYLKRLAPCGLHCGKCFAFSDGDIHALSVKLRENLGDFEPYARRFAVHLDPVFSKYPGFKDMLDYLADSRCGGCRKEKCKFYANCKVRSCAEEKTVDFCFQCPEFPCDHTGLDENLYARHVAINRCIQEIGAEAYYEEIKERPRY